MTECLVLVAAALSTGCSIHPLQQEVTGVKTRELVQYIRCETRVAIQDEAIALLEQEDASNPLLGDLRGRRGMPWDPRLPARLNGGERIIYDRYIRTGIAFDFSFDITEDDSASALADPIKLFTNGAAGLGVSAGGDFKRENLRHFIVSETAQDLLENRQLSCPPGDRSANYTYPIAGRIGIAELISTFFELNEIKTLAVDKATSTVFADTLTFTTTLVGSASPHVIVAPTGNQWGLAGPADIAFSASRADKHALIIGLSLDVPKEGRSVAAAPAGYLGRSALQRGTVHSAAEQSALDAVRQARYDAYLDRASR